MSLVGEPKREGTAQPNGKPQTGRPSYTANRKYTIRRLQRREQSPKHRGSCAGTNSRCVSRVSLRHSLQIAASTHKVLRPAMRGWVAHEPPRTMLCFPSKKSAVGVSSAMLAREGKDTCITRIQRHRLEAGMLLQNSTGPFPHTTQVRLPAELSALLGNRNRVPVLESHVRPLQINEEIARLRTRYCTGVAIRQRVGWGSLIHAVVYEMPDQLACTYRESVG